MTTPVLLARKHRKPGYNLYEITEAGIDWLEQSYTRPHTISIRLTDAELEVLEREPNAWIRRIRNLLRSGDGDEYDSATYWPVDG